MSHQEIFDALWSGPGPAGSMEPERVWATAESVLNDVSETLRKGIGRALGGWSGTAAPNAASGTSWWADWASQAATDASTLKSAVVAQGEFVAYARNTMPAPVEDPGSFPLWSAIPGLAKEAGDWQLPEARQSAFKEQAVHVMETYQNNTEQNKPHIQAFAAP